MAKRSQKELADELKGMGLEGKCVGVHSNLISIGMVAESPISAQEVNKGLSPIGKTVINAFMDAVGPNGTFYVPTHSCNFIGNYMPAQLKVDVQKDVEGKVISRTVIDDGYYHVDKSPSLVGALTQAVLQDDRHIRSWHPTHSVAAIGCDAEYLVKGHTPHSQPVGIHNAFSKTVGLDGIVLFIGDTLKSNTTFHAYETLLMPALAQYFAGAAAVEWEGLKQLVAQTWAPNLHRDFYDEAKRKTRAINAMRDSGLLKESKLGRGIVYHFNAKEMAKYFAEVIYPKEPDILFCKTKETCTAIYDCKNSCDIIKHLYTKKDGSYDAEKIKAGYDKQFMDMMKPGVVRISY
jgi:aminoglycoside N3'-acetyltransferase